MPKRKTRTKGPSKAGFLILVLLCAGAVYGVAQYVKASHASTVPPAERRASSPDVEITRSSPMRPHDGQAVDKPSQNSVFVFSPSFEGEKLNLSKSSVEVPQGEDPKVFAVNEYLRNTKIADQNARLLSVDVRGHVASLFFNEAMNQTFGADDESALLNGILETMGQFPEVDSVLFFSQGKPIDSFGNVDLTSPQAVIRSGEKAATTPPETQKPSR